MQRFAARFGILIGKSSERFAAHRTAYTAGPEAPDPEHLFAMLVSLARERRGGTERRCDKFLTVNLQNQEPIYLRPRMEALMEKIGWVYVPCDIVGNGMFPEERVIRIQAKEGSYSILVEQSLLKEEEGRLFARVTRIEVRGDASLCILPAGDLRSGSRCFRIQNSEVRETQGEEAFA